MKKDQTHCESPVDSTPANACKLCERSLPDNKLREAYVGGHYWDSIRFDRSMFVPRGLFSSEKHKLLAGGGGFVNLCQNRMDCRKAQKEFRS